MPLREKNEAIAVLLETETQQIEPGNSQRESRATAHAPETFTRSQCTAKPQAPFPKQGQATCSYICAFTNTKTKKAKAQLTVFKHLRLLAEAAVSSAWIPAGAEPLHRFPAPTHTIAAAHRCHQQTWTLSCPAFPNLGQGRSCTDHLRIPFNPDVSQQFKISLSFSVNTQTSSPSEQE